MTIGLRGGVTDGAIQLNGVDVITLSAGGIPEVPFVSPATNTHQIASTLYVNDGWIESPELPTTINTTISATHGLGRIPMNVQCFIRCKTIDLGYAVNDEVDFNASLGRNATTVFIRMSSAIPIMSMTTSTVTNITLANWVIVFRYR